MRSKAISLLNELGLNVGESIEVANMELAETAYVHHSRTPVALTAYALASLSLAQKRFPKFSFIDLIHKRPSMDEIEAEAFAGVCGVDIATMYWGNHELFGKHLWDVIERYKLDPFFERVDRRYGSIGDHYLMRPRGIDWNDPDTPEIPDELALWRKNYRKSDLITQLMTATVLQLYKQGDDPYWMVRVPKSWHAAEGVLALHEHGVLADWGKLYALYAGW